MRRAEAMRGARLSKFARELLAEWRRLGLPGGVGGGVVLAVSGGADSTALMLACEELRRAGRLTADVSVAHLNHGLRGRAGAADARWVEELACGLGFEVTVGRASVGRRAGATGDNLEQAARRARYEFLARTARVRGASAVVAAHTLDDQAETVLLRLMRGSGAEGLGGMRAVRPLDAQEEALLLARPLLRWARRADTEDYCRQRGVPARADEMNTDERFARVRVRRRLLPLVETFNPRAVEALARTAELLREDASALETEAAKLLERARDAAASSSIEAGTSSSIDADALSIDEGASPLRVEVLACAPRALRRRALRRWLGEGRGDLRRLELAHVAAVERLLEGERGGRVAELPGGCRVERRRGRLLFRGVAGAKNRESMVKESGRKRI